VEEMLRIIIYDFVSTNIFIVTRLEANILVSCFYFLLNLSLIILASLYSTKNRFYFLEAMTSLCVYVIFYVLRKQGDYNLRLSFAGKMKFEKYFLYTIDYLEGLNGYNLNVQNNRNISYGLKIDDLMRKLVAEGFITTTDEEFESPPQKAKKDNSDNRLAVDWKESVKDCDGIVKCKENAHISDKCDKKEFLFNLFFNEIDCLADKEIKNENNITLTFLKKLIFFRNYEGQNNILNEKKVEKNPNNSNNTEKSPDEIIQSKIILFLIYMIIN